MPVHNEDPAAAFDEIAALLALKSDTPFRINACHRASQVVRALPEEPARCEEIAHRIAWAAAKRRYAKLGAVWVERPVHSTQSALTA